MAIQTERMTVEEFEAFAALPANANRLLEYIGGEVVEVVSNNYSSLVGAQVLIAIGGYVKQHQLGYVTSADGGYMISGERYIPDVAFIAKARQPEPSHDTYNSLPPDLAVEVLSPTDEPFDVRTKVVNYLRAGTTVWVVDPEKKRVEIYKPDASPVAIELDGTLADEDLLPGFSLAVEEIFPD